MVLGPHLSSQGEGQLLSLQPHAASHLRLACTHLQPDHLHQLAHTKSAPPVLRVSMCFFCECTGLSFHMIEGGVLEASDGSQTLALV